MTEGRTRKSIRNILYGVGTQILLLGLGFITRYVFLTFLNEAYLGVATLFTDIFAILSLVDLGIGSTMAYSFYLPLAGHDECKINLLVILYRRVYRVITLVVSVLGLLLIPFLHLIVSLDQAIGNLYIYYAMFLLKNMISYYRSAERTLLISDQKNYVINKIIICSRLFFFIFNILILWLTRSYVLYLAVDILYLLVCNSLCGRMALKDYPYLKRKRFATKISCTQVCRNENNSISCSTEIDRDDINRGHLTTQEKKNLVSLVKAGFLYKISGVLINSTDSTLISIMLGTEMVGFLNNYSMIATRISAFLTTVFQVMTGSVGNLLTAGEKKKGEEVFSVMQYICSSMACVAIPCMYVLMEDLIRVWLGDRYVLENDVLIALLCNVYMSICMGPLWIFREASGIYKKTRYIMLICAVVNIVLSIILGEVMGLPGILLASALSRILTYFWYEPVLLFRTYFLSSPRTYFYNHFITMAGCLLGSVFMYFLFRDFSVEGWIWMILKGMLVFAVSVIMYLFVTVIVRPLRVRAKLVLQSLYIRLKKNNAT